MSVVH